MAIRNHKELKLQIDRLENDMYLREAALRQNLEEAYKKIQPFELLRNTVTGLLKSPEIQGGALDLALGLSSGVLAKKLVTGKSSSLIRKIAGSAAEIMTTKLVADQLPEWKETIKHTIRKLIKNKSNNYA